MIVACTTAFVLDDTAVEVVDHGHAVPRPLEERRHDHDAGREELDVRGRVEAGQLDDAPEELAVEDEPEEGLHEHREDPDRLADEVAHMAAVLEPGVRDRLGHAPSSSSARKSRPV